MTEGMGIDVWKPVPAAEIRKPLCDAIRSHGAAIVNRADVGGQYLNEWQTATAQWLTVVFRPADTTPLPRTGY